MTALHPWSMSSGQLVLASGRPRAHLAQSSAIGQRSLNCRDRVKECQPKATGTSNYVYVCKLIPKCVICTSAKMIVEKIPLTILSRILAQSCITLCLNICSEGLRMIVLESLIVLLRWISLFPRFFTWCIPSLHLHSFS